MQNTKNFDYFFLIKDSVSLIYREIKKTIYKMIFDKISKYTNYTNRIMRKLVDDASKQIRLLFERYF